MVSLKQTLLTGASYSKLPSYTSTMTSFKIIFPFPNNIVFPDFKELTTSIEFTMFQFSNNKYLIKRDRDRETEKRKEINI